MANQNSAAPEIADHELLSYLYGDADAELTKRIEQSEKYQQRVQLLARNMNSLSGQLFRLECLSTQLLGDYYHGLASPSERAIIQDHLLDCPYCTQELISFKSFIGEPKSEPSFMEKIRILIARQLSKFDFQSGQLNPAFAQRDINTGGKEGPIIFEDESGASIQIILDFEDDQTGSFIATGYINGLKEKPVKIDLWMGENPIQTTVLNPENNFEFSGLLPGTYYLIIKSPEIYLTTEQFTR